MKYGTIIIGNKPYKKFKFNKIIDNFKECYRCNLSLPNQNNGTKKGKLALCDHMYANLVSQRVSLDSFIKFYQETYSREEIVNFFNKFDLRAFEEVFFTPAPERSNYNKWLSNHGCPYFFSKMPRTGYTVLFKLILSLKRDLYVSHFSINSEVQKSYANISEIPAFHNTTDEVNILRWLHSNSYVDASLCLLEDNASPTIISDSLKVSPSIKALLNIK